MSNSPSPSSFDYIVEPLRPLAVPIDSVHLDPANARAGHAIDRIAASLAQYKQRKPIVVNTNENNKIEAGNGTWQAARQLGWTHIAAIFLADSPMAATGYAISDNRLGDLSTWDVNTLDLLIKSLDDEMTTGFDEGELDELIEAMNDEGDSDAAADEDNNYSRKIEPPIYEPQGVKPEIKDLYDTTKTDQLIKEIEANNGLSDEEKRFLIAAAQRHTVLNFQRIADYYAHSPVGVQTLMENNALVIIDFNKAIENGFVKLSHELLEMAGLDDER